VLRLALVLLLVVSSFEWKLKMAGVIDILVPLVQCPSLSQEFSLGCCIPLKF